MIDFDHLADDAPGGSTSQLRRDRVGAVPRKLTPPALESLLDAFRDVPDPRVERTRAHPLVNVLTMALFGTICGCDGWDSLELYAEHHADFFATFMTMPKGTPSADTFRRVFEALDPGAFQIAFRRWLAPILENLEGQAIAVDGKTLCGALAHAAGKPGSFHLLHVWATDQRVLLGQRAVEGAPGEPAAAIELLTLLDLQGTTVTADANFCTAAMTATVREAKAHFVISLKANRDALYKHVKKIFAEAEAAGYPDARLSQSRDDDHGRLEARVVRAMPLGSLPPTIKAPWADLKTIVQVDRVRAADGISVARAFYVTSHRADAKQLAQRIRGHWGIENQLHHCLDVTFGDDRRRIRSDQGAQNYALVTRYALSMLKREPTKMSVAMKRRKAMWSATYLLDVLASGMPHV